MGLRQVLGMLSIALAMAGDSLHGGESLDMLQLLCAKSHLVVVGEIASEPIGQSNESGILHYQFDVQVHRRLAGPELPSPTIQVAAVRFESSPKDKLPWLKEGRKCILFLTGSGPATPCWQSADPWFGVQRYSPAMVRAIEQHAAALPAAKSAQRVETDYPVEDKPASINALNEAGFAPLHYAAMQGDVSKAKQLLKSGADVNVRQKTYQGTPLQYAAAQGHVEIIRLLISHDASVDSKDTHLRTPLIWAAQNGHLQAVKVLLECGADPNAATDTGWTAMRHATAKGHSDVAHCLVEAALRRIKPSTGTRRPQ